MVDLSTTTHEKEAPKVTFLYAHSLQGSHNHQCDSICRGEGTSSTTQDTQLAMNVLNRRGFPTIQLRTTVLSVQA